MAAYSSRISRVTTHPVTYPEPNDSNSMRFLLFVRIECADGAVGWGEAICLFCRQHWVLRRKSWTVSRKT